MALVTAAAGLGSTAAAYAGVLPSPIQHFAHVAIGAPAPPPGNSPHAPAVASSPMHGHPGLSPSGAARKQSAASSDPVSDKTRPGQWRYRGWKTDSAAPGLASCPPTQSQDHGQVAGHGQNPAKPSPAPNQAKLGSAGSGSAQNTASPGSVPTGWPTLPSATPACPDGAVPTASAQPRR